MFIDPEIENPVPFGVANEIQRYNQDLFRPPERRGKESFRWVL